MVKDRDAWICAYVRANPGQTLDEIARGTGIPKRKLGGLLERLVDRVALRREADLAHGWRHFSTSPVIDPKNCDDAISGVVAPG